MHVQHRQDNQIILCCFKYKNHYTAPPLQDGILVGAVGAYDWNGAVLKETRQGKVVPPKSSYTQEFPEELKNHGAYLGE